MLPNDEQTRFARPGLMDMKSQDEDLRLQGQSRRPEWNLELDESGQSDDSECAVGEGTQSKLGRHSCHRLLHVETGPEPGPVDKVEGPGRG